MIDDLVEDQDNQCDYDGSYQHYATALDQLGLSRPRGLIPQFGIRLLKVCK